jgi:glycosyltransferase involved in cell wall biosynthesis
VARPKDQAVVLKALALLRTPVRLVMAGVDPAGPLGELARHVPSPHAAVCVSFTPHVRPLYELLDLVLLPSRIEGLSQSLLEAMAIGKPVVASAIPSNAEVMTTESDGLLVEPLDAARWAEAIERLLGDPTAAARLGASARRRAREDFPLRKTVEQTARLYRSIVERHPLAASLSSE